MRYVGGKGRLAPKFLPLLRREIGRPWIEPFVGSAAVISQVPNKTRIGADVHTELIAMHRAVQRGWLPPANISEDEYADIKVNSANYPPELVAFVGFACSFGAKWWGGYARGAGRNYAREGRDNLKKMAPAIKDVLFVNCDYRELKIPAKSLIYCDPPYANTQQYAGVEAFNCDLFWCWCREQDARGHMVVVSEYTGPKEALVLWEYSRAASLDKNTGGKRSIEKLFLL